MSAFLGLAFVSTSVLVWETTRCYIVKAESTNKLCTEGTEWLDVNDCLFFSVILSEWRGHQRNPHCLIFPRWVPNAPFICRYFSFHLTSSPPPPLHFRLLIMQMNPPLSHRTTMPRTKRSWPPPPVISGLPCTTWMQNWILTNKTSLSLVTLHPLLMRTIFLIRLQVRFRCLTLIPFCNSSNLCPNKS